MDGNGEAPRKSLIERFRGDLPTEQRYEWDDITWHSTRGTIKIYGGKSMAMHGVLASIMTVCTIGMIVVVATGYWFGLISLAVCLYGALNGWRLFLRYKALVKRARATQKELATKRARNQGKWSDKLGLNVIDDVDLAEITEASDRVRRDILVDKQVKDLTSMTKGDLQKMARMYNISGRSAMNREELMLELADVYGNPTVYIVEPEFDTTTNEVGELHS